MALQLPPLVPCLLMIFRLFVYSSLTGLNVDTLTCDSDEQAALSVEGVNSDIFNLQTDLLSVSLLCDGRESQPTGEVELCFWIPSSELEVVNPPPTQSASLASQSCQAPER